ALGGVGVQQLMAALERRCELPTKIRCVDDAKVQALAAERRVDMRCVAREQDAAQDLFLDREDEVMPLLREALSERREGPSPIDALRSLVVGLSEQKHPFARIDSQTAGWWRVVAASPSLKARLRELGDEVTVGLAVELAGALARQHAVAQRKRKRAQNRGVCAQRLIVRS
ncbi:MAG: hypothetical protein RL701_8176, partial [Pseudomonadota bacterium]